MIEVAKYEAPKNEISIEDIENKVKQYLQTFGLSSSLTEKEQSQFIEIAKSYKLNPFKREIYCIPYMTNVKLENGKWEQERKLSIITGYEVYLKRAERTGRLDGWRVWTEGCKAKGSLKAIIEINRKDWSKPFTNEVWLKEYFRDNKMWREKPVTMIKKVAIATGFRHCFPDEFAGMPYTADELPDSMTTKVDLPVEEITKQLEKNFSEKEEYIEESKKIPKTAEEVAGQLNDKFPEAEEYIQDVENIPFNDIPPAGVTENPQFAAGEAVPPEYWSDRNNPIYKGLWTEKIGKEWFFKAPGGSS